MNKSSEDAIKKVQEGIMKDTRYGCSYRSWTAVDMLDYLKGPISLFCKQQRGSGPDELLALCDSECAKDKARPPFSILHHAVRGGDADFVKVLLRTAKSFVGLQDDKGETALHYAAKEGDTRIVRELVEFGKSDIFAHSKRGDLPICLAIRGGHLPVVEYMLDHSRRTRNYYFDDKKPRHSFMADAVAHPEILRVLAQHCCAIEGRPVPTSELIFDVAMSGKAGAVGVLIDTGLDIETKRSEDGSGPLHHAAKAGNAEVVHTLLHHGASATANDDAGQTPLHWAVKSANLASDKVTQIAKLLTESGANAEVADGNGNTPTSLARKGRPQDRQLLAILSGARADQSWCYRRAVILYKKQLDQESLRALMMKLVTMKEKEMFNTVLGFL